MDDQLPNQPPAAAGPSPQDAVADVLEANTQKLYQLLEMRLGLYLQEHFGASAVEEYIAAREKDDLVELLMFEAKYGVNLNQLSQEIQAQIQAEVEQQMPDANSDQTDGNEVTQ